MATKEQQANVFLQGKQIDERDQSANVFLGSIPQDKTANVFATDFSLEGINDPRVLKQKEVMAFGKNPLHRSASVFMGQGPDPRDTTARDFIGDMEE